MDPYRLIPKHNSGNLDLLLENLLEEREDLEAYQRQHNRAQLLKENIKVQRFAPWRVSKAVNELVEKKGMKRTNAFKEVIQRIREKGENWNVLAEGGRRTKKRKAKKGMKTRRV